MCRDNREKSIAKHIFVLIVLIFLITSNRFEEHCFIPTEEDIKQEELMLIKEKILSLSPRLRHPDRIAIGVYEATRHYNIPEDLFIALGFRESSFDSMAVSYANARGVWQINANVHFVVPLDSLHYVVPNAMEGARILRKYYNRTQCWEQSLIRYNGWHPQSTFATWVLEAKDLITKRSKDDIQKLSCKDI